MYYDSFYCIGGQNITFNQMHTVRIVRRTKPFSSQTVHLYVSVHTKFKINYYFITYTPLVLIFKSVFTVLTVGLSVFTFVLLVFYLFIYFLTYVRVYCTKSNSKFWALVTILGFGDSAESVLWYMSDKYIYEKTQ